jgi:cysteine-rich repeat protein
VVLFGVLVASCGGESARVVTFSADRGQVYAGATVELRWRVMGAVDVEVSGPAGTIGGGLEGAATSPPLEADTTFVLRAGAVERSLTVRVRERPAVEVLRFGVSSRWLPSTENLIVRWATRFAESASLEKNGQASALDPAEEGSAPIEGAPGDRLVLVARSGALEARSEEIVLEAADGEIEPNDDDSTANPIAGPIVGHIDVGEVDVYRLALPAGAFPEIEVRGADGSCDVPLFLEVRGTDGFALGAAGPGDGCPTIDPNEVWRTTGAIEPGDLLVDVYSADRLRYVLLARAVPPECGNDRVEVLAGENCEGCGTTCRAPGTVDEVEPNDDDGTAMPLAASGVVMGNADGAMDLDFYRVQVPAGSSVVTMTFDEGLGRCAGVVPTATINSAGFLASALVPAPCPTHVLTASAAEDRSVEILVFPLGRYQLRWNVAPIACGNGVIDPGEECDGSPGCGTDCRVVRLGRVDGPGTFDFTGSLPPFGEAAVDVANADIANLTVLLLAGSDGRCKESAPRLRVRDALGRAFASGDDWGPGLCGELDPRRHQAVRRLAPGERTVFFSADDRPLDAFHLTVTLALPRCGDGVVDPGESCDDANSTQGDGCASDCRVDEVTPIVLPVDDLFELPGLGSVRAFTVDLSTPGTFLRVDTVRASGACFADTQAFVLDPGGAVVDMTFGLCGRASAETEIAGTHTIVVQSTNPRPGWHTLRATATPPACGDGRLAPSEACDDGDAISGDGCTACVADPGFGFETEPNDQPGSGPTVTVASSTVATFGGGLWVGDQDWIRLDLAIAATVDVITYGAPGDRASCSGDTVLRVQDDRGIELAYNDDDRSTVPANTCSRILIALQPGAYDVEVTPFGARSAGFYLLDIEVTP